MAWQDQLRPASFRNVPFHVDTIDVSAGDNVVLREYPFQDLPTVFRMGEAAEEIKFSAYVIGPDYIEQREALRRVLTGEGELVHPTAGRMRVYVAGKYTIKEALRTEGGLARFELSFVRANARRYPEAVTNTAAAADDAAKTANVAAQDQFASVFDTAAAPGWAAERAVARLENVLSDAWGAMASASQGLGDFTNEVVGNYTALRDGLQDLVRTPRLLASRIADVLSLPVDVSRAAARDFQAMFGSLFDARSRVPELEFETILMPPVGTGLVMYGAGQLSALQVSTPARSQLEELLAATDRLFETIALAQYVRAALAAELESADELMAARRAINDQATRLMLSASTLAPAGSLPASSTHDALIALQATALAELQARTRSQARLSTYTPQGWASIWELSHRLYGTVAWADEIAALNPHITHPMLVPPGRALRIALH